jgi:hypothetical protein
MDEELSVSEIAAYTGLAPNVVRTLDLARTSLRAHARRLLAQGLELQWDFDRRAGLIVVRMLPEEQAGHGQERAIPLAHIGRTSVDVLATEVFLMLRQAHTGTK